MDTIVLISAMFVYDFGYTHSGRTDANGGHYNRRTGEYHYHRGGRPRPPVNESPHRERYAFLYYKGLVNVVKDGELYPDKADGKDDFVRDPYWATFRAGRFDFSVVVVHVVWGDRVARRQAEVMELAEVYEYVQEANGTEDDVLLVGDFNREPSDTVAYGNLMALPSMTQLFQLPQKSHIRDSSLYDNIFFQKNYVTEYLGSSGIDKFDETDFANDDKAANLAVSDHRPVWAVFRIDGLESTPQPITSAVSS